MEYKLDRFHRPGSDVATFGRRRPLGMFDGAGLFVGDGGSVRAAEGRIMLASPLAPTAAEWSAFADFVQEQADAGAFSGTVLVTDAGVPVVELAYGLADRDAHRANDIDTRFDIASVGKVFTSVAIAQLVEDGELGFDDPIGRHISGFRSDVAEQVTIHQLLTHTSGLADFVRPDEPFPPDARTAATATDLLPLIIAEPLQFRPGTSYHYSDSGFIVLGAVIEAVAGQSYYDYVLDNVFEPAAMTRTDWLIPGQDHDDTAQGYMLVADSALAGRLVDSAAVVPWATPAGGAYSTVGDLQRFSAALLNHELLTPDMTLTVLFGKFPIDGHAHSTAYGFDDATIGGVRIVGHAGDAPGVEAVVDIYPELDFVVTILTNNDGALAAVHRGTREILTSPAAG